MENCSDHMADGWMDGQLMRHDQAYASWNTGSCHYQHLFIGDSLDISPANVLLVMTVQNASQGVFAGFCVSQSMYGTTWQCCRLKLKSNRTRTIILRLVSAPVDWA